MWSDKGIYHLERFNGSDFDAISRLKFPLENLCPLPLCCCDGFFLIYDGKSNACVLWNPITQSKMSFAYPETMNSPYETTHGICYDPLEDDYKVVFIHLVLMLYMVFSCRDNSWTEAKRFPHWAVKGDPGVSVRGVPYWAVHNRRKKEETHHVKRTRYISFDGNHTYVRPYNLDDFTDGIVCFDAKDCVFKKFHKPDELKETDLIQLTSLNGKLCLYQKRRYSMHTDIWVLMQDNNWIKLTSSPPPSCEREMMKKVVVRKENGSVYSLFIAGSKPIILLFDENVASGGCPWKVTYLSTISKVVAMRGSLAILPPRKIAINAA